MAAVGTVDKCLGEYPDLICNILEEERRQGCDVKPGAYSRIRDALVAAVEREVTCANG